MGVGADFGIKTSVDDASIKTFIGHLERLPGMAATIKAALESSFNSIIPVAQKAASVVADTDKKIVASKVDTAEKVKAEIGKIVGKAEQAKDREVQSAQKAEEKIAAIAQKQAQKAEAELAKITAAMEKAKQREIESAQKAEEKIAAIAKRDEDRANAAAAKEAERIAKSKGRTIAELDEHLKLKEKSRKEILALEHHLDEEITAAQKKLTITLDGEEKKRLKATETELKSELAAVKHEAEQRGIASKHKAEGGGEGHGGGFAAGIAGGGAVMLAEKVMEMAKEAQQAMSRLQAATGLEGKELEEASEAAENLGHQYKIGGEAGKLAMSAVGSFTHATGEKLKEQTEDAIILAQKMGTSTEAAAKLLGKAGDPEVAGNLKKLGINLDANATTEQRAAAVHEAAMKAKAGVDRANDNATKNSQEMMMEFQETLGGLASTILGAVNPVLSSLQPLLKSVGEIAKNVLGPAMSVVSIVLTPVFEGLNALKPILPYLAVALGVLAIAMNLTAIATWAVNAAMAVNPFVWIAVAVLALIGIIVLMVKHWDDVVATLKKVWDTITNAGGALLSFLGITGKAEAATKKHKTALEEHGKSVEENKKSTEELASANKDAMKAMDDYTSSIKANQEAQDKSAKEGQDNAIAAIVDIQRKLKTATGEEKAMLEQRLEQWKSYGKNQVKSQEEIEAEKHAASLSIGASVDADEKKKKDTGSKASKDRLAAAKAEADAWLAQRKEDIETATDNDAKVKSQELQAQLEHDQKILDATIEDAKRRKLTADQTAAALKSIQNKISQDNRAIRKSDQDEELKQLQLATSNDLNELEKRGASENLTQGEIAAETYQIKHKALEDQLALETKFGRDTEATQRAIADIERTRMVDAIKQTQAIKKEMRDSEDAQSVEHAKELLDRMKENAATEEQIRQQEVAIEQMEEDQRFAKEMEARKDDLANAKLGMALRESLEANHQGKLTAITRKAESDRRAEQRNTLAQVTGASQVYKLAQDEIHKKFFAPILDNWSKQKTFAMQVMGTIGSAFVNYIEEWAAKQAAMLATQVANSLISSATTTAAAVESAAAWAPAAVSASIATLGAADIAGSAAFAAAQAAGQAIGHLAGGTEDWRGGWSYVGEHGMEMVRLPEHAQVVPHHQIHNVNAGADMAPLLHEMRAVNRGLDRANHSFSKQRTVLAVNDGLRGKFNQSEKAEARRSV